MPIYDMTFADVVAGTILVRSLSSHEPPDVRAAIVPSFTASSRFATVKSEEARLDSLSDPPSSRPRRNDPRSVAR